MQISLSVLGILLAIISFFVSEVEHFPSLLSCLSPKNQHAMEGIEKLETLETSQCFNSNDSGFDEVCDISMELLKEGDKSTDFSPYMIEKFECVAGATVTMPHDAGSFVGKDFVVHLVDRLASDIVRRPTIKRHINNNQLRKKLDERLEARLLHCRFGVLAAGILLIQIPMLIVQFGEGRKKK